MNEESRRQIDSLNIRESDILDTIPLNGAANQDSTLYGTHSGTELGANSTDSRGSENAAQSVCHSGSRLSNSNNYSRAADAGATAGAMLPWGTYKDSPGFPSSISLVDAKSVTGEFVMRTLFAEFTVQAEKKIEAVMLEPLERPLSKSLQRGEDAQFDQLLTTFSSVAEHCLPSLLRTLFAWYDRQGLESATEPPASVRSERPKHDYTASGTATTTASVCDRQEWEQREDRRDLAVEFVFCLVLIEVLKQLHLHPGHEDLIRHLENMSFRHFKYRESASSGPNAANVNLIADLYAEVIGVLAQSRFQSVRARFVHELRELNAKESSQHTSQGIIALLMGMKFFRVKMVPIEDFEASFQFMQELSQYFLEVKDKDIKHALAGLFVEILVPVAACVKNEVNVPCLKSFVEMLYTHTLDMCTKGKHRLAIFPLVTCLLCVSQKQFFLSNWHYFLAMCLSHLKNKDAKMSRVALESLYRLLWVYMIRIKCESNTATQSRLQSIVHSLFPKGSKNVVPRDTPLNIFVKIIQFIAQERLDFAMREIVFDLLSVGRPIKIVTTPERMSIGLRAFLVVADSLQQKEGQPPMPRTVAVLPSGNTLRVKKTFLSSVLTDDTARNIGVASYFPYVRKVFGDTLHALNSQFGRPLLMTNTQNVNKEPDEMITGERKPKIDLFRTCVAAIPRLIPDGLSRSNVIDMLVRLTVHMDEELRALSFQSLQNLVIDIPEWRENVLLELVTFISRDVPDTNQQLLDNALRMLLQLLSTWRNTLGAPFSNSTLRQRELNELSTPVSQASCSPGSDAAGVVHTVEGLALVMLCHCRLSTRRLAVHILKEAKLLFRALDCLPADQSSIIDAIDAACPAIIERCTPVLPSVEKAAVQAASGVDLQWIAERSSTVWSAGVYDDGARSSSLPYLAGADVWRICLVGFLESSIVPAACEHSVLRSWPIVHHRLHALFPAVDPTPVSENRASLLRPTTTAKRPTDQRDVYLGLWRNYALFACRVVPAAAARTTVRCFSPELSSSSANTHMTDSVTSGSSGLYSFTPFSGASSFIGGTGGSSSTLMSVVGGSGGSSSDNNRLSDPVALHRLLVPLLRCEPCVELRDAVTEALGRINHVALPDLMRELVGYIREAIDRKQENVRRRRRRDALRFQLISVFETIADQGTFGACAGVLDAESQSLHSTFVEYIDGACQCLEAEHGEKDGAAGVSGGALAIRLKFCWFVRKLIKSFPLDTRVTLFKRDLRANLFNMFASWSGSLCGVLGGVGGHHVELSGLLSSFASDTTDVFSELQVAAAHAAWTVLCCGPAFDHNLLLEDGPVYSGLDQLLAVAEPASLQLLARETVVMLLEFNADASSLLDWVVDGCYSGNSQLSDSCFHALATVFGAKEYPCDHYTAIINVTLLYTGCARAEMHETAFQLLQLLEERFFGRDDCRLSGAAADNDNSEESATLNGRLSNAGFCRSQQFLSRQMAQLHPELTMPMFSEITCRLRQASSGARQLMLQYLLPWLLNMELVDPHVQPAAVDSSSSRVHFSHPHIHHHHQQQRTQSWGSAEATEMVLNNLLYITAQLGDLHSGEIEQLWAALCCGWPNNLRIILHYLFIMCGMATGELLVYGRRVVVFLVRACPERLVEEMVAELGTVESTCYSVERTETPPFFRLTTLRKVSNQSIMDAVTETDGENLADDSQGAQSRQPIPSMEKGTIHTKRHSGEEMSTECNMSIGSGGGRAHGQSFPSSMRSSSTTSCSTRSQEIKSRVSTLEEAKPLCSNVVDNFAVLRAQNEENVHQSHVWDKTETPQPRPLPMPEYGGYFAPLSKFLPHCSQSIGTFHRCYLAAMLMQDVILECPATSADMWAPHVPLVLHIVFLGGDHSRPLVYDSCRRLLLNLLTVVAAHGDHSAVARAQLCRRIELLDYGIVPAPVSSISSDAHSSFDQRYSANTGNCANSCSSAGTHTGQSPKVAACEDCGARPCPDPMAVFSANDNSEPASLLSVTTDAGDDGLIEGTIPAADASCSLTQRCLALINQLSFHRPNQPLWNHEDVTAREWNIPSALQLSNLLQLVVGVFSESLPMTRIRERWARLTMQVALCCSSRHLAGRSLQIFRALRVPVSSHMLSDILSRLVETVGEQGDDMQGYVAEIMLTLESAVDCIDSEFRPLDSSRELFKSTPNLLNKDTPRRQLVTGSVGPTCGSQLAGQLRATGGYTAAAAAGGVRKRVVAHREPPVAESTVAVVDNGSLERNGGLDRSRSASSLRQMAGAASGEISHPSEPDSEDNKLVLLTQLFWLSVCLLESDFEYEFLLAMRLLQKVMSKVSLERRDCCDKIERMQNQLRWPSFPGVHALLLKGCTNVATYDASIELLSRFTPLLGVSVVDPSLSVAFPLNVLALLPHMIFHYDHADPFCVRAADLIADACMEHSKHLENLATVMTLYSRRTFSKESVQWTKCVVKYLTDTYRDVSVNAVLFLVELLDKGPPYLQPSILSVLGCLLHYMDLGCKSSSVTQVINAELLLTMTRCVQLPASHWQEALRILKLAVAQSSTLPLAPNSQGKTGSVSVESAAIASRIHMLAFAGSESTAIGDLRLAATKKELPGRTMEFSFDVSLTPIIGRHVASPAMLPESAAASEDYAHDTGDRASPRRAVGTGDSTSADASSWRRPWLSQTRTRDRLVQLLVSCGTRVGLPKSPSVIFSQSSDVLERQSSIASSTEEISATAAAVHASAESLDDHEAQQFGVIREFDFLEYELESQEGESLDNFNWGVRRRSLLALDADTATAPESDISLPSLGPLSPSQSLLLPLPATPGGVVATECGDAGVARGARGESTDEEDSVSPIDDIAEQSQFGTSSATARFPDVDEDDEDDDADSRRSSDSLLASSSSSSSVLSVNSSETETGFGVGGVEHGSSSLHRSAGVPALRRRGDDDDDEDDCNDDESGDGISSVLSPAISASNTLVDLSVSPSSLSPYTLAGPSNRHTDLEEEWFRRVAALLSEPSTEDTSAVLHAGDASSDAAEDDSLVCAEAVASIYLLFSRLLADIQRAFVVTVEECLQMIPPPAPPAAEAVAAFCRPLRRAVDLLISLQLPAVYVNGRAVRMIGVEQHLRFYLLELQEHVCTYQERRELVLRRMATMRCSLTLDDTGTPGSGRHLSATAPAVDSSVSAGQLVDHSCLLLFGSLYRLNFQLLLLLDSHCKSLELLSSEPTALGGESGDGGGRLISLSTEITVLRRDLSECAASVDLTSGAADTDSGLTADATLDEALNTREEAETWLARLLAEERCIEALHLFRKHRNLFSSNQLMAYEGDDIDSMLAVYCRLRSGAGCLPLVAVTSVCPLTKACGELQYVNAALLTELRRLERCGRRTPASAPSPVSRASDQTRQQQRRRRRRRLCLAQPDTAASHTADC